MAKALSPEDLGLLQTLGIDSATIEGAARAGLDPNAIASGWLDDSAAFRQKYDNAWDETAFTSNRDGSTNGGAGVPTFQIDAPPDHGNRVLEGIDPGPGPEQNYFENAMSRPPSRTQNRSPIGGPTTTEQEEEDLQRALRESANEAGMPEPVPQESGVVFGPANKEHYDPKQWSLVTTGPQLPTSQVAPPSSRKREHDAPALLYSDGPQHDYRLGGFLTILSEIPLARNALLRVGGPVNSYTHDNDWWKGQTIGSSMEAFYQLIHRLVAFCDSSDRSVASTEGLGEFRNTWYKNVGFFDALLEDENAQQALDGLVHTVHTFTIDPPEAQDDDTSGTFTGQMLFDRTLPSSDYKDTINLYEVLDHYFWQQVLESPNFPCMGTQDMKTLSRVGDVFIIQCDPPVDSQARAKLTIPQCFYPERYVASRKNDAIGFQYLWKKTKRHILPIIDSNPLSRQALPALKERRENLQARLEASDAGLQYIDERPRLSALVASMSNGSDGQEDLQGLPEAPINLAQLEQVNAQCRRELDKTEMQIQDLDDKLKQYIDMEELLANIITDPDGDQPYPDSTCKKYLLCGVMISDGETASTKVVYVCKRSEPTLIELDDESKPEQWWRLQYEKDRNPTVKAEKVEIGQVLNVAQEMPTAKMDIGLVYASEDALKEAKIPLPEPLQRFIKFDNRSFHRELEQEESGQMAFQQNPPALPPRSRPPTPDSMDTNRASGGYGGDEVDSRAGDFDDDDPFQDPYPVPETSDPERQTQIHTHEVDGEDGLVGKDVESPARGSDEMQSSLHTTSEDAQMGGTSQEMKDVSTQPLFLGTGKDILGKETRPPAPDGS